MMQLLQKSVFLAEPINSISAVFVNSSGWPSFLDYNGVTSGLIKSKVDPTCDRKRKGALNAVPTVL
jgi:peptide methionine sulfoxide reductase MsrB